MPIVALANTAGGSGKTTTTLLLATEFARMGFNVSVLDVDPQGWASIYSHSKNADPKIRMIKNVPEGDVMRVAKKERSENRIVLIDLEGTANVGFKQAARAANLVLLPVQECLKTASGAIKTVKMIRKLEAEEGFQSDYRVLFTALDPLCATVEYKDARAPIEKAGIPILEHGLARRREFKGVQRFGLSVSELPLKRYPKRANAHRNLKPVIDEVIGILKSRKASREKDNMKTEGVAA
ncbi:AAA family ATPase [Citreimonas salinaria]|uniref:Chromosome partitioning protein n=1 Tax=Citreimonas salinaria TaxID=321339 RepID=A0A1H3N7X0_9RHOB|nr:AAA family ATPase [Citreimonas salinaria]SDY84843.1 chromosome partitioning protein [Citreimonas salinaria]